MRIKDRMKNRICLILMGIILTFGIFTASAETGRMPSFIQLESGTQRIAQTTLEVSSLLNPEEVSATSTENPIVSEILRTAQEKENLQIQCIPILLVYIPACLLFLFQLTGICLPYTAQTHRVIIRFIHNKDGQKGQPS